MEYSIRERVMIIVLAFLVIHTNAILTTNISLNHTLDGERNANITPRALSATLDSLPIEPLTGDCHLNWKYTDDEDEAPPAPTHIRTRFSCDDKAKICNSTIEWTQPDGKPSVKRYFIMLYKDKRFPNTRLLFCYPLPNTSRSLVIPSENIPISNWVHHQGFFTTDFQIGAETVYMPPPYTQLKGPTPIEITSLEKQAKVHEGEPYNFTCEFTGYPAPTAADIVWKHNDTDVMKKDGYDITFFHKSSSLTILHVSKDDSGSFSCHIKNYLGDSVYAKVYSFNVLPKPPLPLQRPSLRNFQFIIAGGLFSGVLVVALAIYGLRVSKGKRRAHKFQHHPIEIQQRHTIYISHHSQGEEQKKSILKFAYNLEKHSPKLAVVVDLTRQVEINESGGITQWIPKCMSAASRILVVLSKEYLEALNVNKSSTADVPIAGDDQASKFLTEYRFIQNLLHQSFHVSEKMIVVWQSEEKGELPHVFQGRNSFILPRKKKDFVESSLLKLLGEHEENKTESV